ncbi:uncharacterized protein LOC123548373 isoform X1 [Mercenaria mercenaria]|uniref:uncharacterized protein LOC123548373 isoform X1 n=1 Tax=Mercenaria mercenaria TaxID=6596 RepID=UPI001E1E183D|nr:uncharacterized protein LOC123548373 isoform X1 [Mercenaria mercenaria]
MPKRKQQEELCQQVQRKRTSGQGGGDSVQEQAGVPSDLTVGAPLNLSSPVKVKTHNVWIIGDSLIRGAQQAAYLRPDEDLGLGNFVNVLWESVSGMKICDLYDTVQYLLTFNPPPEVLIIHCGGNDLGSSGMTTLKLTWMVKNMLSEWLGMMPNTKFVWCQILPRRSWRYIPDYVIANKMRARVNSCLGTYFIKHGGAYIKFPEINQDPIYFSSDDCHLSSFGYDIMVNIFSGAVYTFLFTSEQVFPKTDMIQLHPVH